MRINLALFLLIATAHVLAQDKPVVRVEVVTTKPAFGQGEPIRYRALLINEGNSSIYVSKMFGQAGGGGAGFYATVNQISGRRPLNGCLSASDRGMEPDNRTPEQILKEDYLALPPHHFVGYETEYSGCAAQYPGKYEIAVEYSAQDYFQNKVRNLKIGGASVLDGAYRSKSAIFLIK